MTALTYMAAHGLQSDLVGARPCPDTAIISYGNPCFIWPVRVSLQRKDFPFYEACLFVSLANAELTHFSTYYVVMSLSS